MSYNESARYHSVSDASWRQEVALHEVTGCAECYLLFWSGEAYCNAAHKFMQRIGPPPDWCPLRRAPLLVRLREKEKE